MNKTILVCINQRYQPNQPSCAARGGIAIAEALEQVVREQHLPLIVERFYCLGQCQHGANVKLASQGRFFNHVTLADIPTIIKWALLEENQ
ncbi:(2Fe-2S) ferredoxin domain-containing protein [Beggiatoa leptomitoformis]|uniref:(2Fe-2S) ferredoxin domain-containing protein n=1 Tax=Beggiatoa leptomitoformis TaxID=288004 RepID=A0A2N9YEB9_9GAMM|nr:(2Fe-2S) ferredoxin domain-containing protein [Beggiatoa leptomitoformis]ALG68822.1 (2Fe-2S) ferredoxin domain-containing protein [Beggiatoa leptomitoformis]AUI68814.1 (2Fe-2S) ferredoxin domain-containing protein [Beggiatoa leptomitoformis]